MKLFIFLAAAIALSCFAARLIGTKSRKATGSRTLAATKKPISVTEIEDRLEVEEINSEKVEPREYQPWLTKAVEHKQRKEFDEALKCLDEAYKACADYDIATVFDHYLRLPYYLQLAGRSDEGWKKLNEFNLGLLPYRGDRPTGSERNVRLRADVSQKMVIFLNREKRFKESLAHLTLAKYLSNTVTRQMFNDKLIDQKAIDRYKMFTKKDLQKAVKKAGLDEGLAEKLNIVIEQEINEGTEELYVLSRVSDVMIEARSLINKSP